MSEPEPPITFMADLYHRWPLWDRDGALEPDSIGISAELKTLMQKWYSFWEEHHHWEKAWDDPSNEAESWVTGCGVIVQLRNEMSDRMEVTDKRPVLSPAAKRLVAARLH